MDVAPVSDEIDFAEGEVGVLDKGGAEERFQRGGGAASGVLVNIDGARIGFQAGSRCRRGPEGRRTFQLSEKQ